MGSSGNEVENGGDKSIAESVGGLVWVRRRNGSWWPGQVVKPDDLPKGSIVPVRSGTPVRLLGHSETSVDWYNLEKSKRVKPFRCGEYDAYIEKARASAATQRKAAKYARRSDAILEALEIENVCLGRRPDHGISARESPSMSHGSQADECMSDEDCDSGEISDSAIGLSPKLKSVHKKRRTPNDSEDDLSEGSKRMRGLEDLGMGVVPNGISVNGSRSCPSLKRRRSPVAHIHESLKRKNRHRPLTKVLENTAMVAVPIMSKQLACSSNAPLQVFSDSKVSGLDSNASKSLSKMKGAKISNAKDVAENDSSERLYDVPLMGENKDSVLHPVVGPCSSGDHRFAVSGSKGSQSCQVEASGRSERVNETFLMSPVAFNGISQQIEKGTSKWQSKGKRNSRQTGKDRKPNSRKYVDMDDEDDYLAGVELSDEFSLGFDQDWSAQISCRDSYSRELTPVVKPPTQSSLPPQRSLPYRHSRFRVPSRYRETDSPGRNVHSSSELFDVEVEVDSYYRPLNVPLVSLTSTLNGLSIVGHRITVEVLDGRLSDNPSRHEADASVSSGPHGANMGYPMKRVSEAGRISRRHLAVQQCRSPDKSPKQRKTGQQPKTRKLSSLTGHKLIEQRNTAVGKRKDPDTSCVPTKVVFDRIKKALDEPLRQLPISYITAVKKSAGPAQRNITEVATRSSRPAQVHESSRQAQPASARAVLPKFIVAVNGTPRPAQHA